MPTQDTIWQRLVCDRGLRSTLFAFTLTRLLVLAIFLLGTNVEIVELNRTFGIDAEEIKVDLKNADVLGRLRALGMRGDSGWYLHIADRGYERIPFDLSEPHNWAFFPLWPLVWRAAATITGGYLFTGIALSNLFFFFALLALHRLANAFGLDEAAADRTVFYVAVFPTSYFFSLPMSESLFLLLTVGSFLAAKKNSWWIASLLAALAASTRVTGLLLLPALLIMQWQSDGKFRPGLKTLSLALVPLGVLAYMAYLRSITGNALAFLEIQPAWGRKAQFFVITLFEYLGDPLELTYKWNFKLLNFLAAMLGFVCAFVLLKRRQWALGVFTLGAVLLPLSSGTLQSIARYMMVVFPVFFVLAIAGRSPRVDQIVRSVCLVSLGIMTLLCTIIVTLALS